METRVWTCSSLESLLVARLHSVLYFFFLFFSQVKPQIRNMTNDHKF